MTVAGERLRSFVERLERLENEKAGIAEDIKEVKREAKGCGFDVKTIAKILRERKLTPAQVAEDQALLELYRAALGMLHDTPLGEAATRHISNRRPDDFAVEPAAPAAEITPEQITEARVQGEAAAKAGVKVTENPYPARDARRAAWDEAWCAALGSDGMEIPDAFRRQKPPAKPKEDGGDDDNKPEGNE